MFGATYNGSEIKNLGLENINVLGNSFTGGLVGGANSSTVSNSYANCDVKKKDGATGTYFGVLFGSAQGSTSATNVFGNSDKSTIKTMIGSGSLSRSSNIRIMSESEFTTPSTWDCFDSSVWIMSCSIPPVLKGVGTNNINWYFGRGNNENRIQTGEGSDPSANSVTINTGLDLGAMKVNFSTVEGCLDAFKCAQAALDAIAKRGANIGASQNKLDSVLQSQATQIENATSAKSTITDADIAQKSAEYTKQQILTQTSSVLLMQDNKLDRNAVTNIINSLR